MCLSLLLVPTADISIPRGIMRFISLDVSIAKGILYSRGNTEVHISRCEYCRGNTDVHMGGNLAPMCRSFLLVRRADISIPVGILRFISLDVSIAGGILMFIWGET